MKNVNMQSAARHSTEKIGTGTAFSAASKSRLRLESWHRGCPLGVLTNDMSAAFENQVTFMCIPSHNFHIKHVGILKIGRILIFMRGALKVMESRQYCRLGSDLWGP